MQESVPEHQRHTFGTVDAVDGVLFISFRNSCRVEVGFISTERFNDSLSEDEDLILNNFFPPFYYNIFHGWFRDYDPYFCDIQNFNC
nr:13519_t:CDS:2 [Entrophospora candida]